MIAAVICIKRLIFFISKNNVVHHAITAILSKMAIDARTVIPAVNTSCFHAKVLTKRTRMDAKAEIVPNNA